MTSRLWGSMPRFAFALPLPRESQDAWRRGADELLTSRANDHRRYLLRRGVYRERVWLQWGRDCPDVTMVLMDCDDVDRATKIPTGQHPDAHARWLRETFVGELHGLPDDAFAFPRPEVLNGRTLRATAASNAQTMFAIPVPDGRLEALRDMMRRVDGGDLEEDHERMLTVAGVHEEWAWLQPAGLGLPPLLLLHWIGDDLVLSWQRAMAAETNTYRAALLEVMSLRSRPREATELDWNLDQVVAMHVRRSDTGRAGAQLLATRLGSALSRRRWDVLADVLSPTATVRGGGGRSGPAVGSEEVLRVVRDHLGEGDLVVTDTLVSETQILTTMEDSSSHPDGLAVLFAVERGTITSIRLLDDHR